ARMIADPTLVATLEGHTDTLGTNAANQTLSDQRAQAVFDYLTAHGVAASRFTRVGYGESQLVDDTHDSMNNSVGGTNSLANRRVVLTVDRLVYTGTVNGFNDPASGGGSYLIPAQPDRGVWLGLS